MSLFVRARPLLEDLAVLGSRFLKRAYDPGLEDAIAATVPGQANFTVPGSPNVCGGCVHLQAEAGKGRGFCRLYMAREQGRRGAPLPTSQLACRDWMDGRAIQPPVTEPQQYEAFGKALRER
jgi:hypothetical protein